MQASSHGCNSTLHHGSNNHPTFLRKRSDSIAHPKILCTNITCFSKARMSVPDPNCPSITVFSHAMSDLIYLIYIKLHRPKVDHTKKQKNIHELLLIFYFPNLFQSTIFRNRWLRNFYDKTSETMLKQTRASHRAKEARFCWLHWVSDLDWAPPMFLLSPLWLIFCPQIRFSPLWANALSLIHRILKPSFSDRRHQLFRKWWTVEMKLIAKDRSSKKEGMKNENVIMISELLK